MLWIKINKGCILSTVFFAVLILCLFSCINDGDDCDVAMEKTSSSHELKLSFVIPNANVATRADSSYVDGSGYENQIDISNHDYRIYFFSYSGDSDESAGTLLAQFVPTRTTSSSSSNETLYTVTGVLPDALLDVSNFRAVVLANWGSYPSVAIGETTIDDLTEDTEGTYSTFLAQDKFTLDANNLIPFYGVQEFTGVNIIEGGITELTDEVHLLRALAKIEVIMSEDCDIDAFDDVSIVNYNSQGYCAPWQVYTSEDYHAEDYSSIGPDNDNWSSVFVDNLHLVSDANIVTVPQTFTQLSNSSGGRDTWALYVPEYDNSGNNYSYITVTINGTVYNIYFATYDEDGTTSAYDANASTEERAKRLNIKRNNLYRFFVTITPNGYFRITVNSWDSSFDNEYTFNTQE